MSAIFPATVRTDTPTSPPVNNAVYSYHYSGGSDGHGAVTEVADGASGTITVSLYSDPRYQISDVVITGDIEDQLSSEPVANSSTSVIITDSDTSTGSGYYKIIVSDTTANCTIACDPVISNVPPVT